jgi:hypothetical protein
MDMLLGILSICTEEELEDGGGGKSGKFPP